MVFNGKVRGDEEGEFTFTKGRGDTMIDYVMGDNEVKERVERMKVRDKIDSDHQPVEIWIRGDKERKREERKGRTTWKGVWDEEGK